MSDTNYDPKEFDAINEIVNRVWKKDNDARRLEEDTQKVEVDKKPPKKAK